jgi:DNA polymerase type B, organellar and viral
MGNEKQKMTNLKNYNAKFDLSTFSNQNVTFLSEQVENKKLFQIGYYHYFKIPNLELEVLKDFLQILDFNKAYIILPILATEDTKGEGPILSLSKQILVTRDSNPIIISNFLLKQIEIACMNYGMDNLGNYTVVLKFRPITLKEEIVGEIPKIQYNIQEKHIKKQINMISFKFFNGTILPLTMKLNMFGKKLNKLTSAIYILKFDLNPEGYFFEKDEFVIYIDKLNNTNHEGILFKDREIVYRFEDILLEGNNFIRTLDKYVIYIDNFNVTHFDRLISNKFITQSKQNAKLNTKIVTFDIETYVKDGKFVPFACGWFDGGFMQTYYLSDYKSSYEMLLQALTEMLIFNSNAKVYIHNFSNFDYMFLIKILFENFIVKPNFKDNKVIKLVYHHKDNDRTQIEIFDSYLILPSRLRTLAFKYKVADLKGFFPYSFVNENNLDYIGITPSISLFNGITPDEYEGLISNTWNLRLELLRYLELDLKSLHQVITRFSIDIFNIEKVDITKLPTNSSIAFKIFRANYLENSKLPIIKGIVHNTMRNAYYGGVVEVFRNEGTDLKYYDVTSLYPFAMLNDMPTGNMLFSTDSNINNYFGIVFVEVDTTGLDSRYLNYPLLPHKIDGRMYNPLGKWTGWYFSEEVKLAISFGYSVNVLYGYKFEKSSNVFNSFINKYFDIKAGFSNINMDRTTAKLILNSLYGRLGMKPYQDNIEIVDSNRALDILSKYSVKEQYQITDKLEFLRYENKPISGFLELYGKDEYLDFMLDCDAKKISINNSLPSAIAITAYARMYMFKVIYKLIDLGIDIYYMDTDSIVVNKAIPEEFIGNKLGLFKLEHEIVHGYFISPKLYALKTTNGELIVKAKGIGSKLEYNQFESLIKNEIIVKAQERWFKDPANANINIKNLDMHISAINLKRIQVMENNKLAFTKPLIVDQDNIKLF